jgi:hypothetical protein
MSKYKSVVQCLNRHGYTDFAFVKKELRALADMLPDNEEPLAAVRGFAGGWNTVLIVLTPRRIIFMDAGVVYGLKISDIPLRAVNAISHSSGIWFCNLIVTNGADNTFVRNVFVKEAKQFSKDVDAALLQWSNGLNNASVVSDADEISKYKKLFDDGVITEAQFMKKRDELLNK